MLLEAALCQETVSILQAIVFGADGACVDIGVFSILGGVALFMALVLLLRFVGSAILRHAFRSLQRTKTSPKQQVADPTSQALQRMPYESPIRSTGAWGRKSR